MFDLAGKIAIVTGGSRGIGRAASVALAGAGAHVLVNYRSNQEAAKETLRLIEAEGGTGEILGFDVADPESVDTVIKDAAKRHARLDILVNNAGIVSGKNLLDISPAEIERTFKVNTLALFWTARAFLPGMLERDRGHLVTIASAAGLAGTSKLTDYCSSKFAAVGFDESLRVELKRQESRVVTTVVCPFYTDTGMFAGVRTRFPWLLPILDPEYVVKRTVRAIEKDRRRLVMPRFVYTGWPTRLLPVAWFDALMAFFGISDSMDEFRGRG